MVQIATYARTPVAEQTTEDFLQLLNLGDEISELNLMNAPWNNNVFTPKIFTQTDVYKGI